MRTRRRDYKKGSTWRYRWEVQISTLHKGLIAYDGLYTKRGALREAKGYEIQPGQRVRVVNVKTGTIALDLNPHYLLAVETVRRRYFDLLNGIKEHRHVRYPRGGNVEASDAALYRVERDASLPDCTTFGADCACNAGYSERHPRT